MPPSNEKLYNFSAEESLTNRQFLMWLHNRIITVYGESENVDFLHRLRDIIEVMP